MNLNRHRQLNMTSNDVTQIGQLILREREGRDRQWWDEMRKAFHPNAEIKISWYQGGPEGFIDGSIKMAKGGLATYHRLRPIVVRVNGNRAVATLSAAIESRVVIDGVEADLDCQARMLYRAKREQNEWKLTHFEAIYQRDTLMAAIPGQTLSIDVDEIQKYRASYRCLSYVFAKRGIPTDQSLPGDDRPELVKKMYDAMFAYLNGNDQGK